MFCSAQLWAKNDYKSCSLPPTDDDEEDYQDTAAAADDADDDDDDDDPSDNDEAEKSKSMDINYVIGNVLQPQSSDTADAIIVHCVGTYLLCFRFLSSGLPTETTTTTTPVVLYRCQENVTDFSKSQGIALEEILVKENCSKTFLKIASTGFLVSLSLYSVPIILCCLLMNVAHLCFSF